MLIVCVSTAVAGFSAEPLISPVSVRGLAAPLWILRAVTSCLVCSWDGHCVCVRSGIADYANLYYSSDHRDPGPDKIGVTCHCGPPVCLLLRLLALITPPDASAAYTAASLAEADGWRTGWLATKMSLVAFIVPFMFAFDQSLLWVGSIWKILGNGLTACIGVWCIAVAGEGYFLRTLKIYERVIAGLSAIFLIFPLGALDLVEGQGWSFSSSTNSV